MGIENKVNINYPQQANHNRAYQVLCASAPLWERLPLLIFRIITQGHNFRSARLKLLASGAAFQLLLDYFIDVLRLFPSPAGLTGLFAQLFHPYEGATGWLEFRLVPV